MKKKDNIRTDFVKESLDKYTELAAKINENTESAVRQMLDEAVRNAYANILKEEDEDYDVDEVEDTEEATDELETDAADNADDGMDSETDDAIDAAEDATEDAEEATDDAIDAAEDADAAVEDDDEGWSEFDKYEVADGKYDLSQAEDDEIVKVYKLLKNDDDVVVNKDGDKVEVKDNETGAEYIITMGGDDQVADQEFEVEVDGDTEDDYDNQDEEDYMNESKLFELVLNEYNSNVGYTDNYQKKDVMTNPGMKEPGKNVNDWDKGVPTGTEKPFSGKKNDKSENQPFTAEKGKQIEEEEIIDGGSDEAPVEEATNVGGFVQQNSTSKSHVPNSNGRSARNASKGGEKIKQTTDPRYDNATNEDIMRKANKIFKENKALKAALGEFKGVLEEAVVTNMNLGNIIRLISENTTSVDEKKAIIERFGKQAKTIDESKNLYETISNELNKREKMTIGESIDFSAKPNTQINETKIYQSKDLLKSLELMDKICKK